MLHGLRVGFAACPKASIGQQVAVGEGDLSPDLALDYLKVCDHLAS